ncbi:MAG TPA: lipid biosynthesis B12-binding/radical SAM protein [Geobacteraceae bacterium]|nr:lipid biosynthesis B12-binding/radical SAM protein [Geobacteraceae bacterium]
MKVLLISANRERTPYPVFPLGLAYLAAPLAAAGHQLAMLDLCFATDPEAAVVEALAEFPAEALVISIRNIDNVTFPLSRSYLSGIRKIVDLYRGSVPVIVGGSGFSLMPMEILAFLDADYGVAGEGEEVLPRLLEFIGKGIAPALLPGVISRGDSGFIAPRLLERIGIPDRSLFAVERYHREGGMANVQTRRGCPFSCIYCTYPLLEGNRMRLRPINDIITELRELVERYGVSYVYFVDDIFNYPPDFAERLCRAIAGAGLPLNWSAFINPDFMSPSLLHVMREAGCDAMEFGTDSGSPIMLKNLGKSFTVDAVRASSRLCRESGMDFAHYLLFGGPGENRETVLESFTLMDELCPTAVIAMTGIRIYPGTAIHRQALADGVIGAGTSLLEPVFYISPSIRDSLCDIITLLAEERKNWIAPGLEINVSDAMLEAMRHFQVRGPLWKLMKSVGRTHLHPMQSKHQTPSAT